MSPRIVITGNTVSGGVVESSKTLSAITIPRASNKASITEISKALSALVVAAKTKGVPSVLDIDLSLRFISSLSSSYEIRRFLLSINSLVV